MKIKTLKIKDFKVFESANLNFDGKNIVIFGENGSGKSSILRAITLLISKPELELENKNSKVILTHSITENEMDIKYNKEKSSIEAELILEKEEDINDNVFISYGIHRFLTDMPQVSKLELQKLSEDMLKIVENAILSMLQDCSCICIDRENNKVCIEKYGKKLSLKHLSDGEKTTLSLFADIAQKLISKNRESENPFMSKAIVLIDEVELHLHPKLQRKIMPKLSEIFPNIQFIVTTHSPQVLGEIGNNFKIFSLEDNEDGAELFEIERLDFFDINYILENFMSTDSINQKTLEFINNMYSLIYDGKLDEAQRAVKKLKAIVGENHEDVVKAELMIRKAKLSK